LWGGWVEIEDVNSSVGYNSVPAYKSNVKEANESFLNVYMTVKGIGKERIRGGVHTSVNPLLYFGLSIQQKAHFLLYQKKIAFLLMHPS